MAIEAKNPFIDLSDAQVEALRVDAAGRIGVVTARIHYTEGRQGAFATLGLGFVAAGIALLTGLLVNASSIGFRPGLWSLLAFGSGVTVTGAMVLTQYALQTNFNYPFKTLTETWKWFYRDALPGADVLGKPTGAPLSKEERQTAEAFFAATWKTFLEREHSLADARVSLLQDLQQLFTLYANEFYKNQFLSRLRNSLRAGLGISAIVALLVLIVSGH